MRAKLLVGGLLLFAAILGGNIFFSHQIASGFSPTARSLAHNSLSQRATHSVRANTFRAITETLKQQFPQLLSEFQKNEQLILYGAMALFGIIMMVLAIGSASPPPKDKNTSMLEALKQEKDKAEHLAKLKSEFLNQVSHELRTPLAVIIGYIECMTDGLYGEIQTKHQEILQVVAKQSSHLKNMIDQILIYSRLESNKQALRLEEVSLSQLFGDLKQTFEFLCQQKGLHLHWHIPESLPKITTDPERAKEILSNLLQNALKYTDKGSISVNAQDVPANGCTIIDVSDTGMGIPQHYLNTIFEPFMQVHKTSTDQSRGGIGLGLSIVKKHVEQLKGTITVDSEIGKGSTFRIVFSRISGSRANPGRRLLMFFKKPFATGIKNPRIPIIREAQSSGTINNGNRAN